MSPPAAEYLPGKAYTSCKTTLISATTSPQAQHPSTSTSSPPISARSPARVPAPAPTFCPIVETQVKPSKATTTHGDTPPPWYSKLAAGAAAEAAAPTPLIPTLPPSNKQVDEKVWADENYPQLIIDTPDAKYDYHYQAQQIGQDAPKRYFSFTNTPTLQTVLKENDVSVSAFEAASTARRPEKWSAPLPPNFQKWSIKGDGKEEMKEGIKPVRKENLPFRTKPSNAEDDETFSK